MFLTVRHGIEKTVYRNAADLIALRQRTEAYGARVQSQTFQLIRKRYIVPSHTLFYFITGHAHRIERHLHRARRIRHTFNLRTQTFLRKHFQYFITVGISAYRTDYAAVKAELRYMIGKVCRSTADFLSFGQAIPKRLTHSYYNLIHDIIILQFYILSSLLQKVKKQGRISSPIQSYTQIGSVVYSGYLCIRLRYPPLTIPCRVARKSVSVSFSSYRKTSTVLPPSSRPPLRFDR